MNTHIDHLRNIKIATGHAQATVSNLCEENRVAVDTIIDERLVRDLVCRLKEAGAEGIIEYPLNKIIP